jgi:dephospho-CoA kinase
VPGSLVVLTGASGAGKTTIARAIERENPEFLVFQFDSMGVPSPEIMASFGGGNQPGGSWQRAVTLQWFERIAPLLHAGRSVLFEGQMRIAFIQEALALHQISQAHVILVECDDQARAARLTYERQQPELANESMMEWSRYLHQEAIEAGYKILDTGLMSLPTSVRLIASCLSENGNPETIV